MVFLKFFAGLVIEVESKKMLRTGIHRERCKDQLRFGAVHKPVCYDLNGRHALADDGDPTVRDRRNVCVVRAQNDGVRRSLVRSQIGVLILQNINRLKRLSDARKDGAVLIRRRSRVARRSQTAK